MTGDSVIDKTELASPKLPAVTTDFLDKVSRCLAEKQQEKEQLQQTLADIDMTLEFVSRAITQEKQLHHILSDVIFQQSKMLTDSTMLRPIQLSVNVDSEHSGTVSKYEAVSYLKSSLAIQDALHHVHQCQQLLRHHMRFLEHRLQMGMQFTGADIIMLPPHLSASPATHAPARPHEWKYWAALAAVALPLIGWGAYSMLTHPEVTEDSAIVATVPDEFAHKFQTVAFLSRAPELPSRATSQQNTAAMLQEMLQPLPDQLEDVVEEEVVISREEQARMAEDHYREALIHLRHSPQKPRNIDQAIIALDQAAQLNHREAAYQLALLYHQGTWVESNLEQAFGYYEKAAALGHPYASYNVALFHLQQHEGLPNDPEAAAPLLEYAAEEGIDEAHYALGLLYEHGALGYVRLEKAIKHYWYAKESGYQPAELPFYDLLRQLDMDESEVGLM